MPDFNTDLDAYLSDSFESELFAFLTDAEPEDSDLAPYLAYATQEAA